MSILGTGDPKIRGVDGKIFCAIGETRPGAPPRRRLHGVGGMQKPPGPRGPPAVAERTTRFELATSTLARWRSSQLSYVRIKKLRRGGAFSVGDTGFEPVTSSVSGKRATAAPIALFRVQHYRMRGGDGIRTRVYGFAGRCLATRPPHRDPNWFPTSGLDDESTITVTCERTTRFELATSTLARWRSSQLSYVRMLICCTVPALLKLPFRCVPTSKNSIRRFPEVPNRRLSRSVSRVFSGKPRPHRERRRGATRRDGMPESRS